MRAPALLAALLPAGVLVLGGWLLSRPAPDPKSPRAQAMEARLMEADPQIVLVGNSTVGAGIDTEALARQTGRRVASAHEDATGAATWYLVLKNRVFEAGLRPELVIIGSFVSPMLGVEPGQLERDALTDHSSPHEPLLSSLSFGQEERPRWQVDQERRRGALRKELIDRARVGAGRLAGRGEVEPALASVFGDEAALDLGLRRNAMPIVDVKAREGQRRTPRPVDVHEGYVPAILDLCAQYGARVVVARFPLRPGTQSDTATAEEVNALVALLNERGAGWVDLEEADLQTQHFKDPLHANRKGQALLTGRLGEALERLGALGAGDIQEAWQVQTSALSREGALPEPVRLTATSTGACTFEAPLPRLPELKGIGRLHQLGLGMAAPVAISLGDPRSGGTLFPNADRLEEGCVDRAVLGPVLRGSFATEGAAVDDLWLSWRAETEVEDKARRRWTWLYPGTRLSLNLTAPAPPGGAALEVHAQLLLLDDEAEAPTLEVPGAAPRVERDRNRLVLRAPLPTRALAGFPILLSLPAGTPPALVEGVRVQSVDDAGQDLPDGPQAWVIGSASMTAPGRARYFGGKAASGRFESSPPAVAAGSARRAPNGMIVLPVPGLKGIDGKRAGKALRKRGATPLVLHLDEAPVSTPPVHCDELGGQPPGSWCHGGEEVRILAPEETAPHRYSVRFDPDRGKSARWLYPGDRVSLPGSARDRGQLRGGATHLYLRGQALPVDGSAADAALVVTIWLKGEPISEARIPIADLQGEEITLALAAATPALSAPVLTLALPPDAPFVLLDEVGLSEGAPAKAPQASPSTAPAEE